MRGSATLTIAEAITRFDLANQASGKSEKTRIWYNEILHSLLRHLKTKYPRPDLCCFNIDELREYILYLHGKPKFKYHPHIPEQNSPISPVTVQDHIRVAKVLSTFLCEEGHMKENRLKALKLPKVDQTIVEPLTYDELNKIMKSIDENSPCGLRNRTIIELMNDGA